MRAVYDYTGRLTGLTDPSSAAARQVVLEEARRLEQIEGADTAAMQAEIARLRAVSRGGARKNLAVGGALVGLGAGGALGMLTGLAPIVHPIAYPLVVAGALTVATAALAGAGAAFNEARIFFGLDRFYREVDGALEGWIHLTVDPSEPPGHWLEAVPAPDPTRPTSRQEILGVMQAAHGYWVTHLDRAGAEAALAEVERDLTGLADRPGLSLREVREELTREVDALDRRKAWVGCGAIAGLVAGLLGLPFVATGIVGAAPIAVGFGGAVLMTALGHVMLRREMRMLTLDRRLADWEEQVNTLRATAGEVHRLSRPGTSSGVQVRAGYLAVGGVRLPSTRRVAAYQEAGPRTLLAANPKQDCRSDR
ncbi:MAG: hypothetical protein AB1758_12370 [Candidatus Eremiobacterota bacterium]